MCVTAVCVLLLYGSAVLMWVIIILYYGFCMYYFYGPEGYNEPPRVPT